MSDIMIFRYCRKVFYSHAETAAFGHFQTCLGTAVFIASPVFLFYNRAKDLLNADKHSPASCAWSTKRWVRGDAYFSGSLQLPLTDRKATAFMSK